MDIEAASVNLFRRHEDKVFGAVKRKLPITLITGFLGAGKTTLLKHILKTKQNLRVAVAVNDFASLNIDSEAVAYLSSSSNAKADQLLQLSNGCFVCSLSKEFEPAVWSLLNDDSSPVDYLVIECSGITDPILAIASLEKKYGKMTRAKLDAVVCVIDTDFVCSQLSTLGPYLDALDQNPTAAHANEDDSTIRVLASQLHAADVVMLNKLDIASDEQVSKVRSFIDARFPHVQVLSTEFSRAPLVSVLSVEEIKADTSNSAVSHESLGPMYTTAPEKTFRQPVGKPKATVTDFASHDAYLSQHQLTELSFACSEPFSLAAVQDFISSPQSHFQNVVRAKGWLWLEEDSGVRCLFHESGRQRYELEREGRWQGPPQNRLIFIGKSDAAAMHSIEEALLQCTTKAAKVSRDASALEQEYNSCVKLIEENGDNMFELMDSVAPPTDSQTRVIHFRLTGVKYYKMTLEHLSQHGVDVSHMNLVFVKSVNFEGRRVLLSYTTDATGMVLCRYALGGQVRLHDVWPTLILHAKKVLDLFFKHVRTCLCGR